MTDLHDAITAQADGPLVTKWIVVAEVITEEGTRKLQFYIPQVERWRGVIAWFVLYGFIVALMGFMVLSDTPRRYWPKWWPLWLTCVAYALVPIALPFALVAAVVVRLALPTCRDDDQNSPPSATEAMETSARRLRALLEYHLSDSPPPTPPPTCRRSQ